MRRTVRTLIAVLAALVVAIPTASAAAGVSTETAAAIAGVASAATILLTAIWNAVEATLGKRVLDDRP